MKKENLVLFVMWPLFAVIVVVLLMVTWLLVPFVEVDMKAEKKVKLPDWLYRLAKKESK